MSSMVRRLSSFSIFDALRTRESRYIIMQSGGRGLKYVLRLDSAHFEYRVDVVHGPSSVVFFLSLTLYEQKNYDRRKESEFFGRTD